MYDENKDRGVGESKGLMGEGGGATETEASLLLDF
jgi:hypothetical protein